GIRDLTVTGVQTCALPIYLDRAGREAEELPARDRVKVAAPAFGEADEQAAGRRKKRREPDRRRRWRERPRRQRDGDLVEVRLARSEERRVGKECETRWGQE